MNHSVYQPFLTNAKQALKLCVQYLIDHLRIYTPILVALSTIDPVLYQNLTEETVGFMRQLPRYVKVLNADKRDTYIIANFCSFPWPSSVDVKMTTIIAESVAQEHKTLRLVQQ